MPSTSKKQHNAMKAAAHGHSTLGIPKSVGQDFAAADKGKSFFQGGSTMSKSSGLQNAFYAKGGSVLGRTTDFLKTADRFRSDGGPNKDPKPEPTEDVWGKGQSKANPKGKDKSLKAIVPK